MYFFCFFTRVFGSIPCALSLAWRILSASFESVGNIDSASPGGGAGVSVADACPESTTVLAGDASSRPVSPGEGTNVPAPEGRRSETESGTLGDTTSGSPREDEAGHVVAGMTNLVELAELAVERRPSDSCTAAAKHLVNLCAVQ